MTALSKRVRNAENSVHVSALPADEFAELLCSRSVLSELLADARRRRHKDVALAKIRSLAELQPLERDLLRIATQIDFMGAGIDTLALSAFLKACNTDLSASTAVYDSERFLQLAQDSLQLPSNLPSYCSSINRHQFGRTKILSLTNLANHG
ncbi:MAG: hypothetical protein MHM6MM_004272 [Cercozoa sp. M6MM]